MDRLLTLQQLKGIQSAILWYIRNHDDGTSVLRAIQTSGYVYNNENIYFNTISYPDPVAQEIEKLLHLPDEITDISITPHILFNLDIMSSFLKADVHIDDEYVSLSVTLPVADVFFDRICPLFDGKYKWSAYKMVGTRFNYLYTLLEDYEGDGYPACIGWLHMRGNEPVYDVFGYKLNSKLPMVAINNAIDRAVNLFGPNIKEIYFVFNKYGHLDKAISRVNDDGELTITVY